MNTRGPRQVRLPPSWRLAHRAVHAHRGAAAGGSEDSSGLVQRRHVGFVVLGAGARTKEFLSSMWVWLRLKCVF